MHEPPLVGWLLVLLCAAAGVYCLGRARTGRAGDREDARGEGLMALGMAAMALPASAVTPPAWSPWLFTALFGAAGVWALVRRHLHHAVGTFAMAYMALAMAVPSAHMNPTGGVAVGAVGPTSSTGPMSPTSSVGSVSAMEHGAPGGVPLLTGLLLAYFTVYVIAAGIRLVPGVRAAESVPEGAGAEAPGDAGPAGVLRACRVAMGIGMLAMLLTV
ncbi:DUF5134 domain-containing protein [Streptomyces decoyicus]|uniref:DUF5134 domain-containing protein n=1 Tax=Streptomyces decoyicus TaxID=249567 RepID=UPI00069F60E3|nr:DUF5134 domain-containing protein [Streptomyces decoyicus]KOG37571.1 membrane protein [Streptomyces decoyicus]QZY14803.1 DUF5134 domain-containing protein [Streptomyces decoyicus]